MRVTALSFLFADTLRGRALISRRLLAVVVATVLALVAGAVPAQAAPSAGQPTVAMAGGSISGTVTAAATGLPVGGATVTVAQPEMADAEPDRVTTTDATGAYVVTGLTIGASYAVTFRAPIDTFLMPEQWDNIHFTGNWNGVLVGQTPVTGIDAALEPGGLLSGVVRTTDGGPVPPVCLFLYANQGADYAENTTCTDAAGNYSLTTLAGADSYYLSVSTTAGAYLDTSYAGEFPTITAGEVATAQDIVLERGATVTGLVVDAGGNPLAGVCARLTGGDYWGGFEACSDAAGRYTTSAVPSGPWQLAFYNYTTGIPRQYYVGGGPASFSAANAQTLDLSTPEQRTLETTTINAGLTITGTVRAAGTLEPITNACVQARPAVVDPNYPGGGACTGADGTYEIAGLIPGDYTVEATGPWSQDYLKATAPGTVTLDGSTSPIVDFVLVLGGNIHGTVVRDDGSPLGSYVCVTAYLPLVPGQFWPVQVGTGCTDNSGHFVIHSLAAGNYLLSASGSGLVMEFYDNVEFPSDATAVPVTAGAATSVDFQLDKAWSLTAFAGDSETTAPVPGIEVTMYAADGSPTLLGVTGADGQLLADVAEWGQYRVGFHDPQGRYADWFAWNQTTLDTADLIYLGPGMQSNVGASLVRVPSSISGTVTDNDGAPLAGATVEAYLGDASTPSATATTDAQGHYSLPGLTAGAYQVRFAAADPAAYQAEWFDNATDRSAATPITIAGAVEGINATLTRATVSASGTVTDAATGLPLAGVTVAVYVRAGVSPLASVTTDAAGHYAVTDLRPGLYTVGFSLNHYAPTSLDVDLTISRTDVDAALTPLPGSISGTITGAGGVKDRACVQVWGLDGVTKVGAPVCVAGGGTYTVSGLVPGSYLVSVTQKNDQTTWYVKAASAATATPVVVGPEAAVTGIDISVKGKPKA